MPPKVLAKHMEEGAALYGGIGFCGWRQRRINYYLDFLDVKFEMPIRYAAEEIWESAGYMSVELVREVDCTCICWINYLVGGY